MIAIELSIFSFFINLHVPSNYIFWSDCECRTREAIYTHYVGSLMFFIGSTYLYNKLKNNTHFKSLIYFKGEQGTWQVLDKLLVAMINAFVSHILLMILWYYTLTAHVA